jgi:hypothetical protein
LAAARRAGEIVRLSAGVWTADTGSPAEVVVASNIWRIVSHHCPDAVVVDRTAARAGRIDGGVVTVATDTRATPLTLPGVTVLVRPLRRHPSDTPWAANLTGSAPARTLVDNLAVTRGSRGRPGRTLTRAELQDWLAERRLAWGDERLERLQVDAQGVAADFGAEVAAEIDVLFDEVSGRVPLREGSGAFARAAVRGTAWDQRRVDLFERAAAHLGDSELLEFAAPFDDGELPFFEAYFSNFIEGTEFTVDDAREIVETQTPPARRSADGHDILGTHRCVVDPIGRAQTSTDPDELIELMRSRHSTLMIGRPDVGRGEFKVSANQAGSVTFVDPDLVHGTLARGLALAGSLPPGLARAIYVMIVVTEVHPFTDGNGRAARLMMNAELSAVGQCRLVVPTVLRNEYVSSLRRISVNDGDPRALVSVLSHAWRWTAAMPWTDQAATDAQLAATNALLDSNEAQRNGEQDRVPWCGGKSSVMLDVFSRRVPVDWGQCRAAC